jgi:ABC-type bacteriocin/lantibiotic exporter with double-glycine peptidase domain
MLMSKVPKIKENAKRRLSEFFSKLKYNGLIRSFLVSFLKLLLVASFTIGCFRFDCKVTQANFFAALIIIIALYVLSVIAFVFLMRNKKTLDLQD